MTHPPRVFAWLFRSAAALALVGGVAAMAGCYAPEIGNHTLRCASGQRCPRGFFCHPDDGLCWLTPASPLAPADAAVDRDAVADGSDAGEAGIDRDVRDGGGPVDQQNPVPDVADSAEDRAISPDVAADIRADVAADTAPDMAADTAVDLTADTPADRPSDACVGNNCPPRPNGTPCAENGVCVSNHCVDGVCCNDVCQGPCLACDVAMAVGTCKAVSGDPRGNRGPCPGTGSCAGTCTGAASGRCTFPAIDVTCAPPVCAGATLTPQRTCDGAGACATPAPVSCGDFRCNGGGTACLTACAVDNDCAQPAAPYCVQQACAAARPNGMRCTLNGECASGHCVDRVCCDAACAGKCQACDLTGHEGACTPVPSGQPRNNRPSCGGTAECAGFCSGALSGACTFPDSSTPCQCQSAPLGLGACDSAGQCHLVGLGGILGQLCL